MPDVAVKIYPNPVKESMTIEFSKQVNGAFEVYTIDGKQILIFGIKGIKSSIPVSSLSNGTYFFKLKDGNHVVNSGSFVVQR